MTDAAVPPSLDELLAPIGQDGFLREHLGRHALRLPARPLRGLDEVDPAAFTEAGPTHVDVIRGGLATSGAPTAVGNACSYRVRRVQVLDATIERFAHALAATLREEVNVNLYVSPDAEAPGLAPHTDPYDLFVVQLRGTKRWELLGDPEHRLADVAIHRRDELTIGTRGELDLRPGEVLYVPRGLLHRAHNAASSPSVHLTVAILAKTIRSCIAWLATEIERRLEPGRAFAIGAPARDYDDALAEIEAAARAILADPDRARAFVAHRELVEYEGIALSPEPTRRWPRR